MVGYIRNFERYSDATVFQFDQKSLMFRKLYEEMIGRRTDAERTQTKTRSPTPLVCGPINHTHAVISVK